MRESRLSFAERHAMGVAADEQHIKVAIHGKIYEWASARVQDQIVLDAGCGAGAGSVMLASSAAHVVAIDFERSTIAKATSSDVPDNLSFDVMDCQAMAFPSASFDAVVSVALLEYLVDVDAFMAEVYRVLRPGGVLICATKNLELSLRDAEGKPLYRSHRQEFTPAQLQSALERRFAEVRLYGEQMNSLSEAYIMNRPALYIERLLVALRIKLIFPTHWRRRIRKLITGIDGSDIAAADFRIVPHESGSPFYVIAWARK